jgi:hypothetical protein
MHFHIALQLLLQLAAVQQVINAAEKLAHNSSRVCRPKPWP